MDLSYFDSDFYESTRESSRLESTESAAIANPTHLGRVIILLWSLALVPAAVLDGDAEEEVEEEVYHDDGGAEGAHDPVEDAHVHLQGCQMAKSDPSPGLHPGATQGKEGIKFCSVA